jgi:hypothetical protein
MVEDALAGVEPSVTHPGLYCAREQAEIKAALKAVHSLSNLKLILRVFKIKINAATKKSFQPLC